MKIIAIRDRFVLGLYRRQMKVIGYLGKIEKRLGAAATTRNWNTIQKIVQILNDTYGLPVGLALPACQAVALAKAGYHAQLEHDRESCEDTWTGFTRIK